MAKKKDSIKHQRELAKQKKLEEIKASQAKKQQMQNDESVKEVVANQKKNNDEQSKLKKFNTNKKSPAKAVGVKSVVRINNDITLINSFGKGNFAVAEQYFDADNDSKMLNENSKIDVNPNDNYYEVKNKSIKDKTAHSDLLNDNNYDLLRLKPTLEKKVFGTKFEDNIHIQICYAAFDIVKAITSQLYNVIYTINSLDRKNSANDVIGYTLGFQIRYSDFDKENKLGKRRDFKAYLNDSEDNFLYFPDVFYTSYYDKESKKTKFKPRSDEEIYNILSAVSFCRNNIGHFNKSFTLFQKRYSYKNFAHVVKTLDNLFNAKANQTDKNFKDNESNNFGIIIDVLKNNYDFVENDENIRELACELYKFSMLKSNKNLGFNLKKLREAAIDNGYINLPFEEKLLNSFKHKLYKIIDFITVYYLNDNPDIVDEIVGSMRSTMSDEEKQKLYNIFAKKVYCSDAMQKCVKAVVEHFKKKSYSNKKLNRRIDYKWFESVKLSKDTVSDFSKLMYLLTRFLDGKEINILLTSLINKFQVIDSFNKSIRDLKDNYKLEVRDVPYTRDYQLFENSGKIAEELSYIKSISKMNNSIENVKYEKQFKDALLTLGVGENMVDSVYEEKYGSNATTKVSAFINNNVIKSSRFKYIVKYVNPKYVHNIGSNKYIIKFVLGTMPKTQIESYYNSVMDKDGILCGYEKQIEELTKIISGISYTEFLDIRNEEKNHKLTSEDKKKKEKKKALITLYYTVVYLVVKNLVTINSQYVKGFSFLDRDKTLYNESGLADGDSKIEKMLTNDKGHYDVLTRFYTGIIESDKIKPHRKSDREKINQYIYENPDDQNYRDLYNQYRNNAMHLSVIQQFGKYVGSIKEVNSYFEIYHNVMQRLLSDKIDKCEDLKKYFSYQKDNGMTVLVDKSYPYSKPVLRAMNVPFGYNLSRYKNLSFEKIFYREQLYEKQKASI